ncbi:alginate export family protein [Oligoflexus sp.]|uniref:alginate export family protein n=1 Tax=Oligoflexus sp. TaxID=1971216 RepID=UPI0039C8DF3A
MLLGSPLSFGALIAKATESEAENLKVIPIGSEGSLTWSTEVRLRYDAHENRFLKENQDDRQSLFRGILGADLRLNPNLRILSEVGAAHVDRNRRLAPPNFENEASLQQLFIEARGSTGSALVGVMIGRQEFSDGPRQLISLSDGPNLHRTWNGVRVYANDSRCRLSGYDLRITRLERGSFDERMDKDERISGLNASFIISPEGEADILVDPFYIQSENPQFRSGKNLGLDERHTLGIRTWGRHDDLRFDWTLALQKGTFMSRRVQAWGVFATQSLTLSQEGWQDPRCHGALVWAAHGDIFSRRLGHYRNWKHAFAGRD